MRILERLASAGVRSMAPVVRRGLARTLPLVLLLLPLVLLLLPLPAPAWAGPVDWQEVPATADGRQWWDKGSLRRDRRGTLSVLSRFQAADAGENTLGTLVVMELDCAGGSIRDRSINGLPQWQAAWKEVASDPLAAAVLQQACAAAPLNHG